jgi:hypothetical protein
MYCTSTMCFYVSSTRVFEVLYCTVLVRTVVEEQRVNKVGVLASTLVLAVTVLVLEYYCTIIVHSSTILYYNYYYVLLY